jgi:hypothetical protein
MPLRSALALLGLFLSTTVGAQLLNLSPYSRFGLGDLYNSGNPSTLTMGGVRTTLNDASILNAENPATLGALFNTTLQTNLRFNGLRISDGDQSNTLTNGFVDQFQMAFKRPGAATGYLIGMSPFSTTGYVIQTEEDLPNVGPVNYTYEGAGGITRAYAGFGRKFNVPTYRYFYDKEGSKTDSVRYNRHVISAGTTLNYYFGNVRQQRLVDIQNATFLDTRATDDFKVSDVNVDIGLHYEWAMRIKFGKDRKIVERLIFQAGLIYSPEFEMNTTVESFSESVIIQSASAFPVDTGFALSGTGSSTMPQRLRSGIAFNYYNRDGRHFLLAADYEQRDWTRFKTTLDEAVIAPGLVTSTEISVGMQYTPKPIEEANNLFQRSNYRAGFRSTATYLSVQGQQVNDRALSLGASIPMVSSRSASKFHLGIEIGGRGENNGVMIREDYVNAFIGFSLSPFFKNAWFIQRKYD